MPKITVHLALTVDLQDILLAPAADDGLSPQWLLPGGPVRADDKTLAHTAVRAFQAATGIELPLTAPLDAAHLSVLDCPQRDPINGPTSAIIYTLDVADWLFKSGNNLKFAGKKWATFPFWNLTSDMIALDHVFPIRELAARHVNHVIP